MCEYETLSNLSARRHRKFSPGGVSWRDTSHLCENKKQIAQLTN